MRRYWLVALALTAGCGGSGGHPFTHDGAADASADQAARDAADATPDAGAGETRTDATLPRDAADAADAGRDGGAPIDATDAMKDVAMDAFMSSCPSQIPAVTVGGPPVTATLAGPSKNPVVSCHGGLMTPGPDAYFTLTLAEATTIDVIVGSAIDTLIAIRPGPCRDAISELTCGADPVPFDVDGGTGLPDPTDSAATTYFSKLRAPLAAGTYTIVVDSYAPGILPSATMQMVIRPVTPLSNATCAASTLLTSGASVTHVPLDLASPPRAICGSAAQSSLFYSVGVGPAQRLTARATPSGGDRTWMPRLEAFSSCSSSACLAQGRFAAGSVQQLDWINNSSAWQLVYLAVGADALVRGATFDLSVTVADAQATCSHPTVVKDGTTLIGQDLSSAAATVQGQTCSGADRALYYAATLLPKQTLNVAVSQSPGSTFFAAPVLSVRPGCDAVRCDTTITNGSFTNSADESRTVIIELAASQAGATSAFDISFSAPPPPPGFVVTPTTDLVTTEAGGTAAFTVALRAPPAADVTVALASDTPTEGKVSPTTLRFTSANWSTPQTVTVTGVDDHVADGPRDYTIVTSPAVSDDDNYNLLDPDDVGVTNLDDDPGLAITGARDLVTSEAGTTRTFGASLNVAPTATVTIALTSSDVGEATVSPPQLTFTAANWSVPQTVTVTGVDDAMVDGTQPYTIVTGTFSSTDSRYAGVNPPDIAGLNRDDDQVAVSPKLLSAEHNCANSNQMLPVAVDEAGRLYIVLVCDGAPWFTTSQDGGVTFTDFTAIPIPDASGGALAIAAGAPGFLYVAYASSSNTMNVVHTTDGGATWSAPFVVTNRTDGMLTVSAARRTVFVVTLAPDGSSSVILTRSTNGGRTFSSSTLSDATIVDAQIGPDGQPAWMISLDGTGTVSKSTDGGETFAKVGELGLDATQHLFGRSHLFTVPAQLEISDLTAATLTSMESVNFLSNPPFGMTVDDRDGFTILDNDSQSRLRATRVIPGQTAPTDGRALGPSPGAAGIASLSRKASAVAFLSGNVVLYTTVVW